MPDPWKLHRPARGGPVLSVPVARLHRCTVASSAGLAIADRKLWDSWTWCQGMVPLRSSSLELHIAPSFMGMAFLFHCFWLPKGGMQLLLQERGATISEEFFRLAQQEERLIFFLEDLSLGGSVKGGCSRTAAGYKSLQNYFPIQTVPDPVSCSILATSDSFRRMIWTRIDHLDLRSSAALAPLPLSPSSFLKTMRNKSERLPMITSRRKKKKKKRNKKKGYKKQKHPSLCNGLLEQPGKNMSGR